MIQLIEAPPRSGKSYFAVHYLIKFTSYDSLYNEYILDSKVLIISNIEGLKIRHWNLDSSLASKIEDRETRTRLLTIPFNKWNMSPAEKNEVLKKFFNIENFEKIMEKTGKNHVILCIDECHEYFPQGFSDNDLYCFFAYHGHIGLDIILMCQSLVATSRMFNPLLEFIVKVTPRSRSILNNFSYSYVDIRGRFLYSRTLPKQELVFNAYKSFRQDEQSKPKNAVKHWIVITVVFLCISGFLFKTALAIVKGKSESSKQKTLSVQTAQVSKTQNQTMRNISSVHKNYSSRSGSASPASPVLFPTSDKEITVIGYAESQGFKRYLLSNGLIRTSRNNLLIGDRYLP